MHKGSKTGNYPSPGGYPYAGQPQDNPRHYSRGEAQYHGGGAGGGGGGGGAGGVGGPGGIRSIHHHSGPPPTQPPTPPNVQSQDLKQQQVQQAPPPPPQLQQAPPPPQHMQQQPPQPNQQVLAPQSLIYNMRPPGPNFVTNSRQQPPNTQRMSAPQRPLMVNNNPPFTMIPPGVYPQMMTGQMIVPTNQFGTRSFYAYPTSPNMLPPQPPQQVYFPPGAVFYPINRSQGGQMTPSQSGVPQAPPSNMGPPGGASVTAAVTGAAGPPHPSMLMPPPPAQPQPQQATQPRQQQRSKRKNALAIVDPATQKEIDIYDDASPSSSDVAGAVEGGAGGGGSHVSLIPNTDTSAVAVEFARKVANSLVNETPSSSTPSLSPAGDPSSSRRDSAASYHPVTDSGSAIEADVMDHPVTVVPQQPEVAARWAAAHAPPAELAGPPTHVPMPGGVMLLHPQDDCMRPPPMVGPWMPEQIGGGATLQCVPMAIPAALQPQPQPPSQMQQMSLKPNKHNETPVVSANTNSPPVDIGRDFPHLGTQRHGGPHPSPGRAKRKTPTTPAPAPKVAETAETELTPSVASTPASASPSTTQPVSELSPNPTPMPTPNDVPKVQMDNGATSIPELSNADGHANTNVTPVATDGKQRNAKRQNKQHNRQQENDRNSPNYPPANSQQPSQQQNQQQSIAFEKLLPAPSSNGGDASAAYLSDASSDAGSNMAVPPDSAVDTTPVPTSASASSLVTSAQAQANNQASSPASNELTTATVVDASSSSSSPSPDNAYVNEKEKSDSVSDDVIISKEDRLVAVMNEENAKLSQLDNNNVHNTNNNITNNNNIDADPVKVIVDSTDSTTTSKSATKIVYKEGQWSPDNREGKKRYDRDFIMQLMQDPQSQRKPKDFPSAQDLLKDSRTSGQSRGANLSSLLQGGIGGGGGGGGGFPGGGPFANNSFMPNARNTDVFMPHYTKTSQRTLTPGGGGSSSGGKRGSSQSKPKPSKPAPIQVSLSLNEDVKLRGSDNPWKPSRTTDSSKLTDEQKKTDLLEKRVRSILNKLTPQKFETLVDQVAKLNIDTHARLRRVIDLVFEKALDEPNFSVAYAAMCKKVSLIAVDDDEAPPPADPSADHPKVNFRKLLIVRCQKHFEKDSSAELNRYDRQREIDAETDAEKKKVLNFQLEEDERKMRVRSVGNIRFIGELYKLGMLNTSIMFSCITKLLEMCSEESLECLCKLLTTIGKGLEEDIKNIKAPAQTSNKEEYQKKMDDLKAMQQQRLDEYKRSFERLQNIAWQKDPSANARTISNRVRFMIRDLIDLRNNRYIPRRDDSNPKTIDQIAREAEQEQLETTINLSAMDNNRRMMGGPSGGGRMSGPMGPSGPSGPMRPNAASGGAKRGDAPVSGATAGGADQGWTTVPQKNSKFPLGGVDWEKMRVEKSETDTSTVQLGSRNNYQWGSRPGAVNSNMTSSKSMSSGVGGSGPMSVGISNKFACLDSDRPSSRNSSFKGNAPQTNVPSSGYSNEYGSSSSNYYNNDDDMRHVANRSSRPQSRDATPPSSHAAPSASLPRGNIPYLPPQTAQATITGPPAPHQNAAPLQSNIQPPCNDNVEIDQSSLKSVCDNYVANGNFPAVCSDIENYPPQVHDQWMLNVLLLAFERKRHAREELARMIARLLTDRVIHPRAFIQGFEKTLELAPEMTIDIPQLWEYLGELCAESVSKGVIIMGDIVSIVSKVITQQPSSEPIDDYMQTMTCADATRFLGALCSSVGKKSSTEGWLSLFKDNIVLFPDEQAYNTFISTYKLDLVQESGPNPPPLKDVTPNIDNDDESLVHRLLLDRLKNNEEFDAITKWIDHSVWWNHKQVSPEQAATFVRTLTHAILDVAIIRARNDWKLEKEIISRHLRILNRYIDNDEKLELHCLFAVQAHMNKLEYPKGVLIDLCDCLWTNGIISTDTFINWRDCKDSRAQNQIGVCHYMLTSFFTMISEELHEDDAT